MDWSWAIEGITEDMPRSTGSECAGFLSAKRKVLESIFVVALSVLAIKWAIQKIESINAVSQQQLHPEPPAAGKQALLVIMTFILGMELGFKLATKTVIFALNPCHITTIIQIYLLAAKPSKTTTALFRIQMNYLNGPLLAFIFPEADSRLLPLEATTYWIQHGLMFIIPVYLLRSKGAYHMENITDFNWNIISYALLCLYHFCFLQIMSVVSNVNLNHMLCAAVSDPFEGPNYRIFAITHQAILCPFVCKIVTVLFTETNQIQLDVKIIKKNSQISYKEYENQTMIASSSSPTETVAATLTTRIDDIITTKID